MYNLFINGKRVDEFQNRIGLLEHLRTETQGETMYIDDTEISVEDLVDTASEDIVTVECDAFDGIYVDVLILEA